MAVTHEAAQKYDVTNIIIAVIYFEYFFSTLISRGFVYYQTISMHLRNELYGVILTLFENGNTYLRWIIKVING